MNRDGQVLPDPSELDETRRSTEVLGLCNRRIYPNRGCRKRVHLVLVFRTDPALGSVARPVDKSKFVNGNYVCKQRILRIIILTRGDAALDPLITLPLLLRLRLDPIAPDLLHRPPSPLATLSL